MKSVIPFFLALTLFCCRPDADRIQSENPFIVNLNEPIDYKRVTARHLEAYARITLENSVSAVNKIAGGSQPTFDHTFVAFDDLFNEMGKAMNNCYMLYWVSTDSLTRARGLAGYQMLDSLSNQIKSDKGLFRTMKLFSESDEYGKLKGHRKKLVDDLIDLFERSGVNLGPEKLERFKSLNAEITDLTTQYSINMNTANLVLKLSEPESEGLPENFKASYAAGEHEYEIPVIPATRGPVMNNAANESVRREFQMKYYSRGADKNMNILDQLIRKRYEIGQLMGHTSYAGYKLKPKMAGDPQRVWDFVNDLVDNARPKAIRDHKKLKAFRNKITGLEADEPVNPWDISYYRNQLLKKEFQVDHEKVREFLPMEKCLEGMMHIYQQLLGYEFRKVEHPSVWHQEVEMYEVYKDDTLRGRFYLDLYPRPNKESWFYGVGLNSGKLKEQGYEVPVNMLLGNFTRPTDQMPSLLSHSELNTLFHEFGHIMDGISYRGEFAFQSDSKSDFVEAMSQIFENWIWDYEILSSFAHHYETGEILPKATFDNMLDAKNVTSGLSAISSLRLCTYDMMIYDRYDPENPVNTDALWRNIDTDLGIVRQYVEGTHPQACWIHINTHPVYYYGYLWSEVYAQDMFTLFEKNGLLDQETGVRYRDLILANGSQRDIVEAVEEFLGRPSDNKAYIKSLGLE
ncbi:MAG: Zn-dependent oligopeptidase [Cytophagales bacterium]|nr:Zn-dependent oligopeptidase [Cytophagales bacterium]